MSPRHRRTASTASKMGSRSVERNEQLRIRESTLHLFSLLGGWPGALIAQELFRHKAKKLEFQFFYWITVVANCLTLAWSTEDGRAAIEALVTNLIRMRT